MTRRPLSHSSDTALRSLYVSHSWPERIAAACACCGVVHEVFVARHDGIGGGAAREDLGVIARSRSGWLRMVGGGRAAWLCGDCGEEVPDREGRVYREAAISRAAWSACRVLDVAATGWAARA